MRECLTGMSVWYRESTLLPMLCSCGSGDDLGELDRERPRGYVPLGWIDTPVMLCSVCLLLSGKLNLRFFWVSAEGGGESAWGNKGEIIQ